MVRKLSEAAQAEIAAAVEILKSDGIHIHKTYEAFKKSLETPEEPTEGSPPPETDPEEGKEKEKKPATKKSLWWGDRANDD